MSLSIIDIFGGHFGYYGNYFIHFLLSNFDVVWSPFAMVLNGIIGLISSIFSLLLTLLAWSNITFSYFVVSLVILFLFGLLIKIFLWLKDIIGHWV